MMWVGGVAAGGSWGGHFRVVRCVVRGRPCALSFHVIVCEKWWILEAEGGQNYNLHPLLLAFHCQHDQRRWASRFGPVSRAEGAGFSHFHVYVRARLDCSGQLLIQNIPTNSPSEI